MIHVVIVHLVEETGVPEWMSVERGHVVVLRVFVEIFHLAIFRRRVYDIAAREQLLVLPLLVVVCNLIILQETKLIQAQ